ncbi:hypothetical protein D3C80_1253530 [compost metagenome]
MPLRRTISAPSAISSGGASPMGEALPMLPPRVPWLRICREAKRCSSSPKSGYSRARDS